MTDRVEFTDEMLRAAVRAMETPDRIQGFSTPQDKSRRTWGSPYYVRDTFLPPSRQELWRGDNCEEMMERCEMERLRIGLAAAMQLVDGEEVGRK